MYLTLVRLARSVTMKAVRVNEFGAPGVLTVEKNLPIPEPGKNQASYRPPFWSNNPWTMVTEMNDFVPTNAEILLSMDEQTFHRTVTKRVAKEKSSSLYPLLTEFKLFPLFCFVRSFHVLLILLVFRIDLD